MLSRALRAISKAICGWLRPCTLGDSSLLVQRRVTRRKDTPEPPKPSCASRSTGRCATRRPHTTRLDSNRCSLKYFRFGCDARRRLRGFENTSERRPDRARVRRSSRGSPVDFHAAERARHVGAPWVRTGYRPMCGRRSDRGVFLLVPFLCTSKEKEPAVGQPPTSSCSLSPKAIRQKIGAGAEPPAITRAAAGGSTRKVP